MAKRRRTVFTHCILVLVIVISKNEAKLSLPGDQCVVDASVSGRTTAPSINCGTQQYPCQYIEQCLDQSGQFYRNVFIRGIYNTTTSTKIRMNLSIFGEENAVLNDPSSFFTFEVESNVKVKVSITNIHLTGRGLVMVGNNADVTIKNCTAYCINDESSGNLITIDGTADNVTVRLIDCAFFDSTDYVLSVEDNATTNQTGHSAKVYVKGCSFTRSRSLFLKSASMKMLVTISNSVFQHVVSSSVVIECTTSSLSTLKIDNCVFQDAIAAVDSTSATDVVVRLTGVDKVTIQCSKFMKISNAGSVLVVGTFSTIVKNSTFEKNHALADNGLGGAIKVKNSLVSFICDCIFIRNKAIKGGSIALVNITTIMISNCIFHHNNAKSFGGDVYLATAYVATLRANLFVNSSSGNSGGSIHSEQATSLSIELGNTFKWCFAPNHGGCLRVLKTESVQINENNNFSRCHSNEGGCLAATLVGRLLIKENNTFSNCSSLKYGGCLSSWKVKVIIIEVKNLFQFCASKIHGGCIAVGKVGHVQIAGNNSFQHCEAHRGDGGCVNFFSVGLVYVTGNNFFGFCSSRGGSGCVAFMKIKETHITGNKFMQGVSGNGGLAGVAYSGLFVATNCTFLEGEALMNGGAVYLSHVDNVTIQHSYFNKNTAIMSGGAISSFRRSEIKVLSTVFRWNKAQFGGALSLKNHVYLRGNFSVAIVGCTLAHNEAYFGGGYHAFYEATATPSQHFIGRSVFLNCSSSVMGQSVYGNEHLTLQDVSVYTYEKSDNYHIYSERSPIIVSNLTLDILRHKDFTRMNPKTNALFITSLGIIVQQQLKMVCPVGFNALKRESYYKPTYSLKSITKGKVKDVFTYLTLQCVACNYSTYTLARGKLTLQCLACGNNTYRLVNGELEAINAQLPPVIENRNCSQCQAGGICDIDVRAKDNHWGYVTSDFEIKFVTCPQGYCCSKDSSECISYNTCAFPRTGTLCGTCGEGYKLSFLTGDCIPKGDNCNFLQFIISVVLFSIAYTATFIIVTNIMDFLTFFKECIRPSKTKELHMEEDKSSENYDENEDDLSIKTAVRHKTSESDFRIGGFVQIVVLYFQVASVLRVKYQGYTQNETKSSSTEGIRELLSNVFNFRYNFYQGVCPSDSLVLPEKEAILFVMKMITFSKLILLMMLYSILRHLCTTIQPVVTSVVNSISDLRNINTNTPNSRRQSQDRRADLGYQVANTPLGLLVGEDSKSDATEFSFLNQKDQGIDFGHRLKLTYLKLLKLYFTPITKKAFEMIHCIAIRDSYNLFVYGELVCYTSWQISIITVILPGLLLFPISYELSLRMLKKGLISSTGFTAATACPYIALPLYICNCKWTMSRTNAKDVDTMTSSPERDFVRRVMESEENLFKEAVDSFSWQTIQFYRTVVMNIATIFLTNPFYRSLVLIPVLFAFAIHDQYRQPYKDHRLNKLQVLTSRCLLLVCCCNLVASVSFTADISSVDGISTLAAVSIVFEIALHALVVLYLPICKVSNVAATRLKRSKKSD